VADIPPDGRVSATRPPEEIIDDVRSGRMVIVVDDEDRGNGGDPVSAAQMATRASVDFIA
jgi:3,4-dihydroxy 2-butanone 4-phosphate synthase/GTP cyclohydrolase II